MKKPSVGDSSCQVNGNWRFSAPWTACTKSLALAAQPLLVWLGRWQNAHVPASLRWPAWKSGPTPSDTWQAPHLLLSTMARRAVNPVATMWTLFYGGDTFCPELAGVQQELQDRYIGAVAAVAERIAHLDNVLGYDTLNEPGNGYIGRSARNLTTARRFFDQDGPAPWSPLEHLAAGDGVTVRREDGEVLNPNGRSIWRHGCPTTGWRNAIRLIRTSPTCRCSRSGMACAHSATCCGTRRLGD